MNTRTETVRWTCDTCGEPVERPEDGWVEWMATRPADSRIGRGLRLVHAYQASPLGPGQCQYDSETDLLGGEVQMDLGLEEFVSPDGLVRLLNLIAGERLPVSEVLEMIQRLHVPHYEQARPFMRKAVASGIVRPRMHGGLLHESQLRVILDWAEG